MSDVGIYVHVPFCLTRCGYCDFNAYAGLDHLAPRYVRALLAEAGLAAPAWADDEVVSIFFGGGTPTTLDVADLKGVLTHLRDRFAVRDDAEVSIEANPDTVDIAKLDGLLAAGFDRLSMGAQSFDRGVLESLERLHSPDSVRTGVRRRPRRRLREREPRPHLRRGRRGPGLVGADAGAGDRPVAGAHQRVRAHDRAGDGARPQGARRARSRRPIPTCRPTCSRPRATCCAVPAISTTRSRTGRSPGTSAGTTSGIGSAARTSASAPARTRSGTTAGGGTSVRRRSTWSASRRGQLPTGGDERLDPSDAYLEEVFLRLRILQGIPSSWVDADVALPFLESGLLQEDDGSLVPTERGMLLLNELVLALAAN